MQFQAPEFIEIKMDAEIGSYQQDEQVPDGDPPFIEVAAE
jgi:hypothetical protein